LAVVAEPYVELRYRLAVRGKKAYKRVVLPRQAHAVIWQHPFVEVVKLAFEWVRILDSDSVLETGPPHADEVVVVFRRVF
jgi:hypothetical protein